MDRRRSKDHRQLAAEAIARMLFTVYPNRRVQHLRAYTTAGADGVYIAGWSEEPAADRIKEVLDDWTLTPLAPKRRKAGKR